HDSVDGGCPDLVVDDGGESGDSPWLWIW
ncbi:hypothetical protein A2U01_0110548, partial [Trifolium medium]|nr:hypothetical protein [Trifolium medium]